MRHLDLFSGIGGFAYAAQQVWEVYETVAFVEWDGFCQQVLKKNFPGVPIHSDIKTFTNTTREGLERGKWEEQKRAGEGFTGSVDLLTGGFPCQPFSQAGRRKGTADDRHLWPEMLRVIREWKPRWVIGENVAGLLTWSEGLVLKQITTDLETEGYEVQCFVIPAVSVNAPHRRDRVWIVAHSESNDNRGKLRASDGEKKAKQRSQDKHQNQTKRPFARSSHDVVGNSEHNGQHGAKNTQGSQERDGSNQKRQKQIRQSKRANPLRFETSSWNQDWTEVATRLCTLDDGISRGLVRPKGWRKAALKAAGNAIVPQVAMEIMKGIKLINTKEE